MGLTGLLFSETTAAAGDIVTEYHDTVVPSFSGGLFAVLGICMALTVAAIVVGVIWVRKHAENWAFGTLIGIIGFFLFSYLLMFLSQVIEPLKNFFYGDGTMNQLIRLGAAIILNTAGLIVGLVYLRSNAERRSIPFNLGTALAYGFGFGAAGLLMGSFISQALTDFLSVINTGVNINQNLSPLGFDGIVNLAVSQGLSEEESVTETLALVDYINSLNSNALAYLWTEFSNLFLAVILTAGAVFTYGAMSGKIGKAWYAVPFLALVVFCVPMALVIFMDFPGWLNMVIDAAAAALMVFLAVYLAKKYMSDDMDRLAEPKKPKNHMQEERPKMPKIVMPDD